MSDITQLESTPPPYFEPIIDKEYGDGRTNIRLSHGLSLVINKENNFAGFHFGGTMSELRYDEQGNLRSEFKSMKSSLGILLSDISHGLDNFKKIVDEGSVELPDSLIAATQNRFLARLYSGLPETSVDVKLFLPNGLETHNVSETDLPDFLIEIPDGLEYSLWYKFKKDLSKTGDKKSVVANLVDNVFKPRIEELLVRVT